MHPYSIHHSRFINITDKPRNKHMRGMTPRALWLDMAKAVNRGPTPEELRREATFNAMGQGADSIEAPKDAMPVEAIPEVAPPVKAPVFMFIRKAPSSFKSKGA